LDATLRFLDPYVYREPNSARDVRTAVGIEGRAVNQPELRIVAVLPQPVGLSQQFGSRISRIRGHALRRLLSAGWYSLVPSRD
jgi:hypothetical protein